MIYGNIARNANFNENFSDKDILESVVDINDMDRKLYESLVEDYLAEMGDIYYLSEGSGKEAIKKMLDMGKNVIKKTANVANKMIDKAVDTLKSDAKDDSSIYQKYSDTFYKNAQSSGIKTKYKKLFDSNGEATFNDIINSGYKIANESNWAATIFKISMGHPDIDSDEEKSKYREKIQASVDKEKKKIDDMCAESKRKYDDFFEESDENETINADPRIISGNVLSGQKLLNGMKDINEKNEKSMNDAVKNAENLYNNVKEDEASYDAIAYKGWYDIISYMNKKLIEADRLALNTVNKYYHECRRAFLSTAGVKSRQEEQKESALMESSIVDNMLDSMIK